MSGMGVASLGRHMNRFSVTIVPAETEAWRYWIEIREYSSEGAYVGLYSQVCVRTPWEDGSAPTSGELMRALAAVLERTLF